MIMTREEAIDWLARVKSNTVNHTLEMPLWWNEPLAGALDMAIKALEQESKTEWIPVSERLPEKNIEVLVTTEWDCITIGEMFSNNDWFIHEGATTTNIDDIKAWMPLPKAYKGESAEHHANDSREKVLLRRDRDIIRALPSVTLIRPKGRWIANAPQYDMFNPQYICSECGNAHTRTTPYCEMCGTEMEEVEEE